MCVAYPGKVIQVDAKANKAIVDFSGNRVTARSGLVDVAPGDYCLVHAGCILQKVEATEAQELAELFRELGE